VVLFSLLPLNIESVPKDEIRVSRARHHGADGFGGATFEVEPDLNLIQKQPAVLAMIELARSHKGIKEKNNLLKSFTKY
jgi:inosine-uridine nucleoside N-ribohydrolase